MGDSDGWFQTVGDDDASLSLGGNLWLFSDIFSNLGQISGVQVVRFGVGFSFRLVTDDVVGVEDGLVQDVFEELWNERSRQVQGEILVSFTSMFT